MQRVVLQRVVLWRVVLQEVVYPCNTTLCFGGQGYEMLEKNTTSTFTNEIAELSKKFAISIILYIYNVPTCSRFAGSLADLYPSKNASAVLNAGVGTPNVTAVATTLRQAVWNCKQNIVLYWIC